MQYDFSLLSKQSQVMEVKGEYFLYKSGLGPIRITPSSGSPVDLMPGQGMSGLKFDKFTVQDMSGANNAGFLLAGVGTWLDSRTTGIVEVVDGGKTRTLAGIAFMAVQFGQAAAGEYPHVQLFNPSTTRRLVVKQIFLSSSVAQQLLLTFFHSPLTGAASAPFNKLPGGPVSVGETRAQSSPTLLGPGALLAPFIAANTSVTTTLTEPIILNPGCGMVVRAGSTGSAITVAFEHIEEAF